ncbi:MAG: hypothetical protein C0518_06775 [Opitutus sp.]|nr:hypothetical protein [Opitutus sp.]
MSTPKFRLRRRIYVGGALAVVAVAGWWAWTNRAREAQAATARAAEPFVRVSAPGQGTGDRALQERADLFDPAPLFIPTARNFGQGQLPARLVKQPGQVFGDFGAKLNFNDGGLGTYGAEQLTASENLVDVLARSNEVPFAGLGESGTARSRLTPRSAFVQIKKMGESELREFAVTEVRVPRTDFSPLEFVVAVGPAGLMGDPLLTRGSGREDVDLFFQDFLAKTSRLGSLLSPGRYRVLIGP